MIRFMLFAVTAALAGCASNDVPVFDFDPGEFEPAVVSADPPKPVKIIEMPTPLPLPGQLKPAPGDRPAPRDADDARPQERVVAANDAARFQPTQDGYVNAIQVYPFVRGALYQVYAAPAQVTDIALQPGEQLVSVSAGDTVRWVVGDTTSGAGEDARVHILVKPTAAGLKTNLVITTDRRAYYLDLQSTDETYIASVAWSYPHDDLLALQARNAHNAAASDRIIEHGVALSDLKFRYVISGDDVPWRPLRAFDDERQVYIQFPKNLGQGEAPPLFVVGAKGRAQLVNYRVKGPYYIVDRLFAVAELRLGEKHQQVVRITRILREGEGS